MQSDKENLFPSKKSMLKNKKIPFKKIVLYSNHYKIKENDQTLYPTEWYLKIFDKINPQNGDDNLKIYKKLPGSLKSTIEADSRDLIREIIGKNLKSIRKKLGQFFYAGNLGYSIVRKFIEENFYFEDHGEFILALEKKNEGFSLNDLIANSKSRYLPLQFLNSRIKNCMFESNLIPFGFNRQFYDLHSPEELTQFGLNIYKGYLSTFDVYEGGIKLLSDLSFKIIRTENVWEYFKKEGIKNNDKKNILRFFDGLICMGDYGNNRKWKISGVDFKKTPLSPFPDKQFKNFKEYFEKRYKKKIKYSEQFLLTSELKTYVIKNKKRVPQIDIIYLIPELLRPTGLKEKQRKDRRVMKEVGYVTIINPEKRIKKIEDMIRNVFKKKNDRLSFEVDLNSNKIIGYKMNLPKIVTGKGVFGIKNDRINVSNLEKKKKLASWIIIYDERMAKHLETLKNNLKKCSNRFDIKISKPKEIILPGSKYYNNKKFAKEFLKDFHKEELTEFKKPQIIFYFISTRTAAFLYNPVKLFYQKKGIPTQFYVSHTPKDTNNLSKFTNLLLQINCKLGGRLWSIENEVKDCLLMGVEMSKIKIGDNKRSIVSLVSQAGNNFSDMRNYSKSRKIEDMKKSYLNCLPALFMECLEDYKNDYGKLPKNILLYRYGMGEGQIRYSIDFELNVIIKELEKKYGSKTPGFIYIIVNKKINDRFFTKEKIMRNPSGVVVCDDVVQKDRANFYLIAQKVTQGTATPTHYMIIYNKKSDIGFSDVISITYHMTFDYKNWMGPIRVPSVLMYASKLSFLNAQIETDKIHAKLKAVPFYI